MTTGRLLTDAGFRVHLVVYLAVNLMLAVIDWLTGPQSTWFFWPLLGWGLGLLAHAIQVLRSNGSATAS